MFGLHWVCSLAPPSGGAGSFALDIDGTGVYSACAGAVGPFPPRTRSDAGFLMKRPRAPSPYGQVQLDALEAPVSLAGFEFRPPLRYFAAARRKLSRVHSHGFADQGSIGLRFDMERTMGPPRPDSEEA